eukprot:Awhi_evm1s3561
MATGNTPVVFDSRANNASCSAISTTAKELTTSSLITDAVLKPLTDLRKSNNPFIIPFTHRWYMVTFITHSTLGHLYAYSMYTNQLLEVGLSPSQLALLGIAGQAGQGLAQYPIHVVSTYLNRYLSPKSIDRVISSVCGAILIFGFFSIGIIIFFLEKNNEKDDFGTGIQQGIFVAMFILQLLYGVGSGLSATHVLDVTNYNFINQESAKRVGLSLLSVGFAF